MQRLYYSISEVSKILDEESYVLRYWEKEFSQISPKKNRSGKRVYSDRDLEVLKIVKKLLRNDKLSVQGAKEQIDKLKLIGADDKLFDDEVFVSDSDKDSDKEINANVNSNDSVVESFNKIKIKLENLLEQINVL